MFDWTDGVLVALALIVLGMVFAFLRILVSSETTDMKSRKFITSARQTMPDGCKGPEVKFDPPVSIYEALMATKAARPHEP